MSTTIYAHGDLAIMSNFFIMRLIVPRVYRASVVDYVSYALAQWPHSAGDEAGVLQDSRQRGGGPRDGVFSADVVRKLIKTAARQRLYFQLYHCYLRDNVAPRTRGSPCSVHVTSSSSA
eukprot:1274586-Prymnesium_polylepis.1